MVLSNAERQRRYRQRLKAKAAAGSPDIPTTDPATMKLPDLRRELMAMLAFLSRHPANDRARLLRKEIERRERRKGGKGK